MAAKQLLEVIEEAISIVEQSDEGAVESSHLVKQLEDKGYPSTDVSGGLALGIIQEDLHLDWDLNITKGDARQK